jgi:uncharacterized protein involved in exopolysaccharide biosynthesis
MTTSAVSNNGDLSFFEIGAVLLRHRWRIVRWTFAGAVIAVALVITRPALYEASVSFAPQGNDSQRAGLAGLASQFGVALPIGSGQSLSPDFYAKLIKSREVLRRIASDTFAVSEESERPLRFADLLKIKAPTALQRQDRAIEMLTQMVNTSVSKATGIIEVTVDTKWRSLSIAIATALINEVNDFNQRTRREQAGAERRFVEGQLASATTDLRSAEDRLEEFLRGNKTFNSSPELVLQRDRLQSEVDQRRQVVNTLTQSYEDVRLREVRDTPVITVIEAPSAPGTPEPRGRTKVVLLGIMLGGFVGVVIVLSSEMIARRRAASDAATLDFLEAFAAFRNDLGTPWHWITGHRGR